MHIVLPPELTLRLEPVSPVVGYREAAHAEALVIERRWSASAPWCVMPAAVPWLGIGVVLVGLAARAAGEDPRSSALLWGILIGWLGLTLLFGWEAIASVVNHTRIVLDDRGLRLGHGPLRLPGIAACAIARDELAGFCVELEPRGDLGLAHWIVARRADGARLRLLQLDDARVACDVRDVLSARVVS